MKIETYDKYDDRAPIDPDISLITDYLVKELPDAEMAAVEERLVTDEEFFEKVWPLVRIWNVPVKLRDLRPLESPPKPKPWGVRTVARTYVWVPALAAAALAGVIVVRQMSRETVAPANTEPPERVAVRDSILRSLQSDSLVARLPGPTLIATGADESREVAVGDSARIKLGPNSWVAFSIQPAPLAPEVVVGGDAQVEVSRPGRTVTVVTSVGNASLGAGRYMLKAMPKKDVLFGVLKGVAQLRGKKGASRGPITIKDGERGSLTPTGPRRIRPDSR